MPHEDPISIILKQRDVVVLDGALATELESRGLDLNHPLWSAKILKEQPEEVSQYLVSAVALRMDFVRNQLPVFKEKPFVAILP
jgi:hypothetical protein